MNVKIVKNLQRWTIKTSIVLTWTQMHEVIGTNIEKPSAKSIFCSLFPWENRTSFMRKVSTSYAGQCCKICWFLAFFRVFQVVKFQVIQVWVMLAKFCHFSQKFVNFLSWWPLPFFRQCRVLQHWSRESFQTRSLQSEWYKYRFEHNHKRMISLLESYMVWIVLQKWL